MMTNINKVAVSNIINLANDSISFDNSDFLPTEDAPRSVTFWFFRNSSWYLQSTTIPLVGWGVNSGCSDHEFDILIYGGELCVEACGGFIDSSGLSVEDNYWHYIGVTYSNGTITFYMVQCGSVNRSSLLYYVV
jgi:hypothetical protein